MRRDLNARQFRGPRVGLLEIAITCLALMFAAVLLFPIVASADDNGVTTCLQRQRALAAALVMWAQDHDGKLPPAATWNTGLSKAYHLDGKAFDCPASPLAGSEANPDFFYVGGGHFLAGVAVKDVANPALAPLVGDRKVVEGASASFINADADNPADLAKPFALVDARHGDGAVFAYVDGHAALVPAAQLHPAIFAPSLTPAIPARPLKLGTLLVKPVRTSDSNLGATKDLLSALLIPCGFTVAMGEYDGKYRGPRGLNFYRAGKRGAYWLGKAGNLPAGAPGVGQAEPPRWWKRGDETATRISPYGADFQERGGAAFAWGSDERAYYLIAGRMGDSTLPATTVLTIVPDVPRPTVKKMALLVDTGPYARTHKTQATIDYIEIGGKDYDFTDTVTSSGIDDSNDACAMAHGYLLPVHPGQEITIQLTLQKAIFGGCSLIFED
jgi:prepilin-type processing-associated H-X9-DG protein